MKTNMLVRVRQHFSNPLSPRRVNRHNMRAWVTSIRFLQTGSKKKWLLAEQVVRVVK